VFFFEVAKRNKKNGFFRVVYEPQRIFGAYTTKKMKNIWSIKKKVVPLHNFFSRIPCGNINSF